MSNLSESLISADAKKMPNEKKLEWVYVKSNKLRCWDEIRLEAACRVTLGGEENTGSYFVPRTVRAVFNWGKRGRGNRHKWSNYLGMRSLFGSISSRLWPREAQPSSTTGCVISSLRPPRLYEDIFQRVRLRDILSSSWLCDQTCVEQASKW